MRPAPGRPFEVFVAFLKLGVSSFGGPIAHIAYFRREFVLQRAWLDEGRFGQLLALCQFLPGPASSQLGFSLGILRAGWAGGLAAFAAFTLPSALLLFAFATVLPGISGAAGNAAIHGLKLVAVVVVAHALLGMVRQLCPDATRRSIAAAGVALVLLSGAAWIQLTVVALGAAAGLAFCRDVPPGSSEGFPLPHRPAAGGILIGVFATLLVLLPLAADRMGGLAAIVDAFYRAGALVFGGGHVVLPLLKDAVVNPGWISLDEFLAGYGAAQAVPGPMFTLAAYLGARLPGAEGGAVGALIAVISIFLPGLLLVAGALPLWSSLPRHPAATSAVAGVNAAVVGLLGAAFYDPVWTSAVQRPSDVAIAVVGFVLLAAWRLSALYVVLWCVAAALLRALLA
jgi:chromate transporter